MIQSLTHFRDTSIKTRTLVRKQGWTPVDVGALPIDWSCLAFWTGERDKRDLVHYQEMVEWCDHRVGRENYACTLQRGGGGDHNVKRFRFKQAKHATLFRLKWL
jgi:hypothetical protein